jgi:ribosomal protein S18 acetylase RimI-like enzyme
LEEKTLVLRAPSLGLFNNPYQSITGIRTFEEHDLQKVMALVSEVFNETYDPNLYISLSKEWPEGVMVAELEGEIIGFLLSTIQRPLQTRILILGIREAHRGKGIGRALMHSIINRSIIKGHHSMTLEVRVSNERGQAFYSRLGFEVIGMIPDFYTDHESAFLLKKVLG